jgi:hypothetical protein
MYGFITLYLLLICGKIAYDLQNGYKLDEYYRTGCDINGKINPDNPKYCEADLSDMRPDEDERKIP